MSARFYYYVGVFPDGRDRSGLIRLPTQILSKASNWIEEQLNCVVVRVYRLPDAIDAAMSWLSDLVRPQINKKELPSMMRDLAVMVNSGISVMQAIMSFAEDEEDENISKGVRRVAQDLLVDLKAGGTLSEAINKYPKLFPESVRSMILIGQEAGNLDHMLTEAADHLERVAKMGADAKQAMIYPAFVFIALFGVGFFWIYYVMPNLMGLFKQMKVPLPAITVATLAASEWLTKNITLFFSIIISTFAVNIYAWKQVSAYKRFFHHLFHRIPIIKTLRQASGLAFFSEYLSILVRSGVDIVHCLRIMSNAMKDLYYKERIEKMLGYLERGNRLSDAMRKVGGFPSMMKRMVSVGEDSGTLDEQLMRLAKDYKNRLDLMIGSLSEILKPIIVVIAGGFFMFLIVALLLPIYDLIGQSMSVKK